MADEQREAVGLPENPERRARTAEERKVLDLRDGRLILGVMRKDPALDAEARAVLEGYFRALAKRYAFWLLQARRWSDFKQEAYALLYRWRDEDGLRPGDGLWRLARALMKQVMNKLSTGERLDWDVKEKCQRLSAALDAEEHGLPAQEWMEAAVTTAIFGGRRFPRADQQAALREQYEWVVAASEKLPETEEATLAGVGAVVFGQFERLGEALSCPDATARKRLQRLRAALGRVAEEERNAAMLRRLTGRKLGPAEAEPAEILACQAYSLEELEAFRDGDLETAKRIEIELHLKTCASCKLRLRTLASVEDALDSFFLMPPLPVGPAGDPATGGRPWGRVAVGVVAAVAVAAVAWIFGGRTEAPPAQPRPPPPAKRVPVAVPLKQRLYSAPKKAEAADAGVKDGGK